MTARVGGSEDRRGRGIMGCHAVFVDPGLITRVANPGVQRRVNVMCGRWQLTLKSLATALKTFWVLADMAENTL